MEEAGRGWIFCKMVLRNRWTFPYYKIVSISLDSFSPYLLLSDWFYGVSWYQISSLNSTNWLRFLTDIVSNQIQRNESKKCITLISLIDLQKERNFCDFLQINAMFRRAFFLRQFSLNLQKFEGISITFYNCGFIEKIWNLTVFVKSNQLEFMEFLIQCLKTRRLFGSKATWKVRSSQFPTDVELCILIIEYFQAI